MRARILNDKRTQSASLIALGAFAIHQLRDLVVGPGADHELARQSNDFIGHLLPLLVGLILAGLSARVARSFLGGGMRSSERRLRITSYAVGIAAVFFSQELMEGVLLAGHASGPAAIFSAGGWAALPLAVLFGVVAAIVDRGIEEIETRLSPAPRQTLPPARSFELPDPPVPLARRLTPLAFGLASRPPPSLA